MIEQNLLESLRFYLEESEDAMTDTTPIKIDGSLCVKCSGFLAGYCVPKNMNAPYTKVCDKYTPKVMK